MEFQHILIVKGQIIKKIESTQKGVIEIDLIKKDQKQSLVHLEIRFSFISLFFILRLFFY